MEPQQIGKLMDQALRAPEPSSSLPALKTTLTTSTDPDLQVIKLKYKAKQIGQMTPQEVMTWGKSLLLKIHVITGWVIPNSDLLVILVDQFQKKLIESYPDMNVEEIEFAFRQSGTTVKDWGKAMNLSLIDEVLIPYLDERIRLSHTYEERKATPPEQVILSDKQLDDLHRGDVENFFQRLRTGKIPTHDFPVYFCNILEKDNLLRPGETIADFFVRRLGNGSQSIYVRA